MEIVIKKLNKNQDLLNKVQIFLFNQIKREFGYGYVPEWHQDIISLDDYYVNPKNNNFYVAFNEKTDEIIATIGIRAYDKNFTQFRDKYSKDNTASIWRLFVDKAYRRCGLGSKMFCISENFAKEVGFENIYLHTHKTLPGALEFWTKMGFIVALDSNDDLQTVHMDKNIQSIDINQGLSSFKYPIEF